MSIIQASAHHEPSIRRLLERGRRIYQNFGGEDLASLLKKQLVFVAEEQARLWGVVIAGVEERPLTLPADAPARAYLRALALETGHAPAQAVPDLLLPVIQALRRRSHPTLLIVYGGEPWLIDLLPRLDFSLTERVQFFRLDHLERQSKIQTLKSKIIQFRPMQPGDLDAVAQLDAQIFEPLWHYGSKDLWELLFTCRIQLAFHNDQLTGYTAVAISAGEAHLVRIAVHPTLQGQRIGRQLLLDVIEYLRENQITQLSLNTQVSNEQSQRFYRSFGFHPTRQMVPVFTQVVQPHSLLSQSPL